MPAGLIPNYRNEMSSHYYNGESRGRWHDTDPTLAPVMDEGIRDFETLTFKNGKQMARNATVAAICVCKKLNCT